MTRTRPLHLVVLAAIGAAAGVLLQLALGAAGAAKLVPPVSLSVTLVLIAVVVVALAFPVRRATRSSEGGPVDPFYATRVVLIAKASALAGALLAGGGLGILLEMLGRPAFGAGPVWGAVAMLVAAIALLVAGLVAESFCMIPPEDDDPAAGAGTGPTAAP